MVYDFTGKRNLGCFITTSVLVLWLNQRQTATLWTTIELTVVDVCDSARPVQLMHASLPRPDRFRLLGCHSRGLPAESLQRLWQLETIVESTDEPPLPMTSGRWRRQAVTVWFQMSRSTPATLQRLNSQRLPLPFHCPFFFLSFFLLFFLCFFEKTGPRLTSRVGGHSRQFPLATWLRHQVRDVRAVFRIQTGPWVTLLLKSAQIQLLLCIFV